MKVNHLIPVAAICLMASACGTGKNAGELTSGIYPKNLDTTAVAGDDFNQFANGGWMANNPIPAEYGRYGAFEVLRNNNVEQIQGLIAELSSTTHEQGTVAQKIGDLYNLVMDTVKLNNDGVAPIKAQLTQLAALQSKADVYALLGSMQKQGIVSYLGVYVGADAMNSDVNALNIVQYGLSMGERDYYLEDSEASKKIREAFRVHVAKMYQLAGMDEAVAKQGVEVVIDVETRLAKAFRSRTELRDVQANYNKMSMEEVKTLTPSFDWESFWSAMDIKEVKEVIVGQPESLKAAADIINTLPVEKQSLYLQWKLINDAAGSLSQAFDEQNFDFYGRTMTGTQEQQPRWKRAVASVSGTLGEALGQMYVEKYFPAAAKERMVALVKNLQESLGERIQALEWMGDETKQKALEKLATFTVKIGYPDKWKDYSTLSIDKNVSLWENRLRANEWEHADMIAKLGQPVDRSEWHMTPQTVNAYYNPSTNEICFPAGILQYPFFDMNADDAFNYGAIGVVIGHEMTHGFDDQGRHFDKKGDMKGWWTEEDSKKFEERSQVLVDHFNNIEVAPGVHANGSMTLGENIADQGGLQIAYQAFKKATAANPLGEKDGFTADQRFFLSYAGVWAANIRPETVLNYTKTDVHSLGRWRVNGALPHVAAWYDAFGVTENNALYLPVEKRASIW